LGKEFIINYLIGKSLLVMYFSSIAFIILGIFYRGDLTGKIILTIIGIILLIITLFSSKKWYDYLKKKD